MTSGAIKPTRSTHLRPTAQPHTAQPHTAPHRRVGCHVSQGAVSCVPRTSQPPHTMHGTLLSNSHHPREGLLRPSSTSHTTLAAGGRVGGAGGGGGGLAAAAAAVNLQHGGEDGRNFRGHARSKDGVHCAERREDREFLALGLRQPVAVSGRRRRQAIIQRSASQTATDDAAAALRCGGGVSLSLSLSHVGWALGSARPSPHGRMRASSAGSSSSCTCSSPT